MTRGRRQIRRTAAIATAAAGVLALGAGVVAGRTAAETGSRAEQARPAADRAAVARALARQRSVVFPLKVAKNRRYLVDQRNAPFLIVGDSPQALIGNLSVKDAAFYINNRAAAGFNTLWVNLLCAKYTGCRSDGTTFDHIKPFTTPGNLATPNPAYFARADAIIQLAAKAGIVVFLNPIETGGWLSIIKKNGLAKARAYGRFLGRRYNRFANIVWYSGNDFQTWSNSADDAAALAVAKGIHSVDRRHLQTVELDYPTSGSLDDARWRSLIKVNAAYTYYPTYAQVLHEYNRKDFLPVFMAEAGYEFEQNSSSISRGDPPILRRQAYWTMLSGAAGQFYGNHYTWQFTDGWKDHLDTPGSVQMGYLARLFSSRPWFTLVPDQAHKLVTGGYGTYSATGTVGSSNYVTTAATRDRRLAMSYLPNGGSITVNLARMKGRVSGRWYDPTNGTFRSVRNAPFARGATVHLATPGKNADGDRDWVLVLSARSG